MLVLPLLVPLRLLLQSKVLHCCEKVWTCAVLVCLVSFSSFSCPGCFVSALCLQLSLRMILPKQADNLKYLKLAILHILATCPLPPWLLSCTSWAVAQ